MKIFSLFCLENEQKIWYLILHISESTHYLIMKQNCYHYLLVVFYLLCLFSLIMLRFFLLLLLCQCFSCAHIGIDVWSSTD